MMNMKTTTISIAIMTMSLSAAGCSAMINLEDYGPCGNEIFEPELGEECDNGPENSDTVPNACRSDCRNAYCGDGITDTGEHCDSGPENGQPERCNVACTGYEGDEVCGNDVREGTEECDGGDLGSVTECTDLDPYPYNGGGLGCTDQCRLEASECTDDGAGCYVVGTLECEVPIASSTTAAGSTDAMLNHCYVHEDRHTGREIVYRFVAQTDEWVHVDLRGLTGDLDISVFRAAMGACQPVGCVGLGGASLGVAGDSTREFASFQGEQGQEYLIVIDGWDGATSDFELVLHCGVEENCTNGQDDLDNGLVDCEDPVCFSIPDTCPEVCDDGLDNDVDGAFDCGDEDCYNSVPCTCQTSLTITCDVNNTIFTIGGDTSGAPSSITTGWCTNVFNYTGPEEVFELDYGASIPTLVTATLDSMSANLDLIVLSSDTGWGEVCGPQYCFTGSSQPGTLEENIGFTPETGQRYLFVVDGVAGAVSSFNLTIECEF